MRLAKVEEDLIEIQKDRNQIIGFIRYARVVTGLLVIVLSYLGLKIGI